MDINKINPVKWYKDFQEYGGFPELFGDTKEVLKNTSIEILLCGAIGLYGGTSVMYGKEKAREAHIPLGFSEISQIEKDAERYGQKLGSMNEYLPKVNDMTMKVFESWNLSNENLIFKNNTEKFARELDMNMDRSFKTHRYNLKMLLDDNNRLCTNALNSLKYFNYVSSKMNKINDQFDKTWDDDHIDTSRIAVDISTDSKGNTTITTRVVYDYTTHFYNYDKEYGQRASINLDLMLKEYPNLKFNESLRIASRTNAEGEWAAEKSRKIKDNSRLNQDELKKIANTWIDGSTLMKNLDDIYSTYGSIKNNANLWRIAKTTAKDDSYITHSHTDKGPKEFQIVENSIEDGKNLCGLINEVTNSIKFTQKKTPILENKIKEYISVTLDNKKGNPEKLKKEIISLTTDIYEKNFREGFDVKRFRWNMVLLGSLLGSIAGLGAGFILDKSGDTFNWYHSRREN